MQSDVYKNVCDSRKMLCGSHWENLRTILGGNKKTGTKPSANIYLCNPFYAVCTEARYRLNKD